MFHMEHPRARGPCLDGRRREYRPKQTKIFRRGYRRVVSMLLSVKNITGGFTMKLSSFIPRVFAKADTPPESRAAEDNDKPLNLRITGVGVAHVDPGELLRSKKMQQQMDAVHAFFEEQAAREQPEERHVRTEHLGKCPACGHPLVARHFARLS